MKLSSLLEKLEYTCVQGSTEQEVTGVVYDSRKVTDGSLFICIRGAVVDGHKFIPDVTAKGAKVLIVEEEVSAPSDVTVIQVTDTRYAMAFISAAWFGHPAEKLKTIGITGTKGKTTTTYMVKSILENAGYKVGLIGTIEAIIGNKIIPASNTTPESYVVQEYFHEMVEAGCDCVVMEVSSQGLMLHRTQGFVFDFGIFTNIEPDHIGPNEHKDFDHYLSCKAMLLKQCRVGIVSRCCKALVLPPVRDKQGQWTCKQATSHPTIRTPVHPSAPITGTKHPRSTLSPEHPAFKRIICCCHTGMRLSVRSAA